MIGDWLRKALDPHRHLSRATRDAISASESDRAEVAEITARMKRRADAAAEQVRQVTGNEVVDRLRGVRL